MKENRNQLKHHAANCLEKNDFPKAIEIYRRLVSLGDFSIDTLSNLSVSEDQERLAFAREVSRIDGWNSKYYQAQVASVIKRYAYTIKVCTDVIESFDLEVEDEVRVRLLRFKSSCLCGDRQLLIADFLAVWRSGNISRSFRLLRKGMLKNIAAIQDPNMYGILMDLAKKEELPIEIIDFINKKSEELKSLKRSIGSID